jgi:hypothetical protein
VVKNKKIKHMKKNLQITAVAIALGFAAATAQTGRQAGQPTQVITGVTEGNAPAEKVVSFTKRSCATLPPTPEWDTWFNQKVEEFKAQQASNGKVMAAYTIPVIVHVIHSGQATGTFPNISQAQINSQITVLNQDFASNGLNVGNLPATFSSAKANTQVTFCLATKNPTGGTLTEPGIERINATTMTAALTGTFTSKDPNNSVYNNMFKFQDFVDNYIKANTIWDPTRYMNIWVTNEQAAVQLLGYATFPAGTGLSGLSAPFGTATTDGLWCYAASFGSSSIAAGTYAPPYDKGRTAVHEIGHWVGLRHIWGDDLGACTGTDYCNDTPNQADENYSCPTFSTNASCSNGGDMSMNFMDYTDDACMYIFTNDQNTRIQTAMANGTYRSQLSTSSLTLCSIAASTPTSSFNLATTACTSVGVIPTNNSTGSPSPTYSWSSSPSAGVSFMPNSTATTPTITFNNAGSHTITLVATNSVGANSSTNVISITTCTPPPMSCNDTLTNFKNTDTLTIYGPNLGGGNTGYVSGNNSYTDLEKSEYYNSTGLVGTAQVTGGIILFYRHATANIGTKGTGTITVKYYNGNNTTGPAGAALSSVSVPLSSITGVTGVSNVQYCGNPSLAFSTNIIRPLNFTFPAPVNISGDFHISVKLPLTTGDTAVIFQNSGLNGQTFSTAWELWSPSGWYSFDDASSWGQNASLAILPKIQCIGMGISNPNGISNNIAIFPNPSSGKFYFAVTMPDASDLNFTVINSIGQQVYSKIEPNVGSAVVGMDLSHLAKGIYFVNIVDKSGDKVVKKIIIE